MSHLGRWLSALVDGELDGAERDRVLNHVAGCEACRQEANAMRALKRRLTALGETSAESAIASRLIELARSDQGVPAGRRDAPPRCGRGLTRAAPPTAGTSDRQGWRMAAGSAGSALLAIGVIAFLLGNARSSPRHRRSRRRSTATCCSTAYDAGQAPAGSRPGSAGQPTPAGQAHVTAAARRGAAQPSPAQLGQRLAVLRRKPASPGPVTSAVASPCRSRRRPPARPRRPLDHAAARQTRTRRAAAPGSPDDLALLEALAARDRVSRHWRSARWRRSPGRERPGGRQRPG